MSVIGSNILAGASGQGGGYNLTRSLRFRRSASANLTKTPASAGNRQKFTWSVWVKRGALESATSYYIHSSGPNTSSDRSEFLFTGDYTIVVGFNISGTWYEPATTAVFRDPSAWYHIVAAVDTTQATDSNRIKIYVNGVQQTLSGTFPPQNSSTSVNNTVAQAIGYYTPSSAGYFDGYMSEFNFIDGQALTPSDFGENNAQTGVWQPKRYSGTYGTNGFYLPFTDNSALTSGSNAGLGKDFSGNGNYWNTNNISITSGSTYDSMTDVPTLTSATASNFCVLNPLANPNGTIVTYSNGNLAFSHSSSAGNANKMTVQGTMAIPAGKFYWEYTVGATVNDQLGIGTMLVVGGSADGTAGARYLNGGTFQSSYTTPSSAASYTTGDVIGMAYDQPNGTLAFYKNNSLQGTVTNISTSEVFFPLRSPNSSGSGGAGVFNFGQRPFAYTPPTGFQSLNTYNLPTPTIGATASTQANKYFDVLTWTGNGSNPRSLTGLNFAPDFVWTKNRSVGYTHSLYDSVRGAGANKELVSASTGAEGGENHDQYGYLSSFDSNGFTTAAGSAGQNYYFNDTTYPAYVAWNWKANGTGVTNTAGSITSTVSANTSAGFSVVTYTGTGANATFGHGLGVTPKMFIIKTRSTSDFWVVWHSSFTSTQYLLLNSTNAVDTAAGYFNSTLPNSTVISLGNDTRVNGNGTTYVCYAFSEIAGYSKFGSYTGNGSTDGVFVYTGFRPKYVMVKRTSDTGSWLVYDSVRNIYNPEDLYLLPNSSGAEGTSTYFDFLSNGFKLRTTDGGGNGSGSTYIYMAFAEVPTKFSLAR